MKKPFLSPMNTRKILLMIRFHRVEFQSVFILDFVTDISDHYPGAMELYLKALRIAEKYNISRQLSEVLNRLGILFRDTKDLPTSLFYYTLARLLFDSSRNDSTSATARAYPWKFVLFHGSTRISLTTCLNGRNKELKGTSMEISSKNG